MKLNMKRFKFIYLLLAVVGVVSFASCQHEYADWAPGAADANAGVYFPDTQNLVVEAGDTSVDIPVTRVNAGEALTVSVRSEDVESCGFFTVPASVNFEAGSQDAKLTITFDGSKLVPGKQYPILIKLSDDSASQYGVSEYIFKIGIAEPWISLGMGIYRDDFLSPLYGGPSGIMTEMEVFQHELEPNRYRLINPYSEAKVPYIIGGVPEDMTFAGEGYIEFVVVDQTKVYIPSSPLGFKLDVGTGQLEDFFLASVFADETTPIFGEFSEGVFWFTQPSSIMWHIADGRGNYANQEGLFAVALPGYEIKDYAMSAAYAGMIVEADNTTRYGVVEFALGLNVDSYKFTVLPGGVTDVADTVKGIVDGSEELEIVEATASQLSWTLSLDEAGLYTVVAVPYEAGEAQVEDTLTYVFYFPADATEFPSAEIKVFMDSLANMTGDEKWEKDFPAGYYACVGVKANPVEVRNVKLYVGRLDDIMNSGLKFEEVVAQYGDDVTEDVLKGLVLGPYNLQTGSLNVALVAVETVYGETQFYNVEYTMPNVSGLELGDYTITEGDYKAEVSFLGGAKPGIAYFAVDGMEFEGKIDDKAKTITFNGYEPYYCDAQTPSLFNQIAFYYDKEKTQTYGFWSASDEKLEKACDLVLTFDEAGVVNALKNYFAKCVFNAKDSKFVKYDFFFSSKATIAKVVEEAPEAPETPETPEEQPEAGKSRLASAKSLNAGLTMTSSFNASSIEAKPFDGEVKREMKANVSFRF